jgi:hypothetical protein
MKKQADDSLSLVLPGGFFPVNAAMLFSSFHPGPGTCRIAEHAILSNSAV